MSTQIKLIVRLETKSAQNPFQKIEKEIYFPFERLTRKLSFHEKIAWFSTTQVACVKHKSDRAATYNQW